MARKPRENGWRDPLGVTHHIDTRRVDAYHAHTRMATCGVSLHEARRVRFDAVDCMTCIVRVAKRQRLAPRPTPNHATLSWWTTGGDRHVLSQNNFWRAVCGVSLRTAQGSGNPPNCVPCGGRPGGVTRTQSLRSPDGVRHEMRLDDRAPCGADLLEATVARKAPNCPGCRAAITGARRTQEGRDHGRLPQRR